MLPHLRPSDSSKSRTAAYEKQCSSPAAKTAVKPAVVASSTIVSPTAVETMTLLDSHNNIEAVDHNEQQHENNNGSNNNNGNSTMPPQDNGSNGVAMKENGDTDGVVISASAAGSGGRLAAALEAANSDSRFGGLAGAVEQSVRSFNTSKDNDAMSEKGGMDGSGHGGGGSGSFRLKKPGMPFAPFPVTPADMGLLAEERTRVALADLLEKGIARIENPLPVENGKSVDEEAPPIDQKLKHDVLQLVARVRDAEEKGLYNDHDDAPTSLDHKHSHHAHKDTAKKEADENVDMAANVVTSVMLRSSPVSGIDPREVEFRREVFGTNAVAERKLESYCKLCYDAVQDFVLIMLIILGIIGIVVNVFTHEGPCTTCWIEGAAILVSVVIVVNVTATIDYSKQFAFQKLSRSLQETNIKQVIRDAKQVSVTDEDIVVGDILSVNSHNLASIPADCILLGPAADLKMDESALTGESKLISKKPGDIILSGTNAIQGSGKMVVIAVGAYSVSGKIRARVYEANEDDELGGEDENSPLFVKLETIAKKIGIAGTVAACVAFFASCIIGLGIKGDDVKYLVTYLITAITVLAVAVPEGLPLAVTLSLAFSSNKMMQDMNLVKHLDACETMGCATTICTDKTGTLTANKMTARAIFFAMKNFLVTDPAMTLGAYVKSEFISESNEVIDLICSCVAINTMNETVLYKSSTNPSVVESSSGNPTEVALLVLVNDLGQDYETIRNGTKGRSDQGKLGEFLADGKQFGFSSARKMMSWAIPMFEHHDPSKPFHDEDEIIGYRVFCKGASEVVMARCTKYQTDSGTAEFTETESDEMQEVSFQYARRGMRCLALSYRDVPASFDLDSLSEDILNSDGSKAFNVETDMTLLALVGLEDPLRKEVPGAIEKCYRAGIDVRLVTGDSPNTAVSIAYQAGILRDSHFLDGTTERVSSNLKENVLLEGRDFRRRCYTIKEGGEKEFDQSQFDSIWPHLRVLARSSPDDKLTLAHGLNQSNLFADKQFCKNMLLNEGITIFPDRQVVAMTGDGTNDAPALKRADIGFAMGISGTQIAKDAADIILLDDNFASIVTAAKWGRNIYASIQKFLQFQLTVNISAVVTALVGALTYQTSPLAAIQLLWVNLLMDSLASLALASEPPTESLLEKPPVNRTDSMITNRMWANMIGQATYQIIVVMVLLFKGPVLFGLKPGHLVEREDGGNSVHYTIIFNAFVWMQLFNEINSRKLKGEWNVFEGLFSNPLFYWIMIITSVLQCLIHEFGFIAFHVSRGGLDWQYWVLSLVLGSISIPVQQIINILYSIGQGYNLSKNKKRLAKEGNLTKAHAERH